MTKLGQDQGHLVASRSRRSRSPSDSRSREKLENLGQYQTCARKVGKELDHFPKKTELVENEQSLIPLKKSRIKERKRELSEKEEDSQSSKKVKREPSEEKKGKSGPKSKKGAPKRKYGKCPYYSSSHLMEFAVVLLNTVSLNPLPPFFKISVMTLLCLICTVVFCKISEKE